MDDERLASATAMGFRLLEHEPDAAAIDRVLPPGGLRKKAGEIGFVGALQDAAGDIGQALIGQDDQPRQIVLEMPKLALVVKQVAEDRRVLGDHRSRRYNRQFHHTPPCPCQGLEPGPRVAWGSWHGKSQLSSHQVEAAEMDERGSCVGKTAQQRWLWQAIDHASGVILAYVCGVHEDEVFLQLKEYLRPFGLSRVYTDNAGVYSRHLAPDHHAVGKQPTQKIERKHLTRRTRMKRLARKTICFSKSILMHDMVLGLFVNRDEFALPI